MPRPDEDGRDSTIEPDPNWTIVFAYWAHLTKRLAQALCRVSELPFERQRLPVHPQSQHRASAAIALLVRPFVKPTFTL
jgi:hypothetical protein